MKGIYLVVPFAPLAGALVAGLLGWLIGPKATHRVTILGMLASFCAACLVLRDVLAMRFVRNARRSRAAQYI